MRHNNSKRKYQTTIEKTKDIKNRSKKLESIKNLTSKNINAGRREILHYLEEYPNDMFGYFHGFPWFESFTKKMSRLLHNFVGFTTGKCQQSTTDR